jgi:hypothetical protein
VEFQYVVVHSVENWEADVAKQKLISGDRMDYHHHARLTIYSREQLAKSVVEGRLSLREAAAERGLSRQSASKWVKRFRQGLFEFQTIFLCLIPLPCSSALSEILAVDLSTDPFRTVTAAECSVGSVLAVSGVAEKNGQQHKASHFGSDCAGIAEVGQNPGGNAQITYKKPSRFYSSTLSRS